MGKLFGTNGIRGRIGFELKPDIIIKIGLAVGTYFNGGEILIGQDGRTSSPIVKRALISGILATGCNISDAGLITTPALQYGIWKLKFDGGVMITASHNPPEFNGIKVIGEDGIEIPRKKEEEIERIFFEEKIKRAAWNRLGKVRDAPEIIPIYVEAIKRQVNVKRISTYGFNLLRDPGNGVSTLTVPKLLKELNCKFQLVNDAIDGRFPGRGPEPTPQALRDISKITKKINADLGVSYDGDGDRAIFTDEEGKVHWGDKTGAIIAKHLLTKNNGGIIVTPVSSSIVVKKVAEKYGGIINWTKVGSVVVSHELKRVNGLMGMEENGGVMYPKHQYVRDGAMTTALILELIAEKKKKLAELIARLPKYYSSKEKIKCPNNLKNIIIKKLTEEVKNSMKNKSKIEVIDGVKIWLNKDTWVLVRASGTEPLIRIYAEAKELEEAKNNAIKYKKKIASLLGG